MTRIAQMRIVTGIDASEVIRGQQFFAANCAVCHGARGERGGNPEVVYVVGIA